MRRCYRVWPSVGVLVLASLPIWITPPLEGASPQADKCHATRCRAGLFEIGVGVSDRIAESPDDWKLLTSQFGSVTPENCMKPAAVQKAEGEFDFQRPDQFVEFATQHQLAARGTLPGLGQGRSNTRLVLPRRGQAGQP